jgi:hypothetical protein
MMLVSDKSTGVKTSVVKPDPDPQRSEFGFELMLSIN